MVTNTKIIINGKYYTIGRILKDNKNYICLKDLETAGFEVGYDKETKIPTLTNKPMELELMVDDKITSFEVVNINGNNFVPIRSLAASTGAFNVDFTDGRVVITTAKINGK